MRFAVGLPTDRVGLPDEFLSDGAVGEAARAVEAAGFDACFVTDHPIPGHEWVKRGGHHSLDPFVALSFAAAATHGLRLMTNALVLAYRNPFLSAKALATLDVLSGGRVIAGIAAGYLESEFEALGIDAGERNELTDEAIETMKRVWSEEDLHVAGRHFAAKGNSALPQPAQKPHPPLWVGGNSRRAIRRAVEHADGWLPFPAPARMAAHVRTAAIETKGDLQAGLDYARDHAEKVGRRQSLEVCFVPFELALSASEPPDPAQLRETASELSEIGVTWLALNVPCATRAEFCDRVAALGAALHQNSDRSIG